MDLKSVRKLSLCDVETRTLREICTRARIQPNTVSVRKIKFLILLSSKTSLASITLKTSSE